MATRLYFHAALAEGPGIYPTTEQSALTSDKNVDAQTVNRLMNANVGAAQTSIVLSSLADTNANDYYFTKFISYPINQSGIAANTWTYTFGATQNNANANFPVNGTNKAGYVNCYVWRPSTGAIVGTILDGATAATLDEGVTSELYHIVNFTGSAVAGAQAGDVIVFEIWFQTTQGNATARTDTFWYDGTTVGTENGASSNAASYIETPEDVTFQSPPTIATKLYFHSVVCAISGTLPTTEQSTLTSDKDADAQTVNRMMDSSIGISQTSIVLATTTSTSLQNYYFTKFISWPLIGITSINIDNWKYAFAAQESNTSGNFPVGAANSPVYLNVYVWRPSTGAIVGTILDGNTDAVYAECSTANTERAMYGSFLGSSVSSISDGDVIVCEIWFPNTHAGIGSSYNLTFFFDGTTENTTLNATVSNHASFIGTWQTLTFVKTAVATLPTETVNVTESPILARLSTKARALATETVSKSETLARLSAKWKRIVTIERWF